MIEEQRLRPRFHDCLEFDCGVAALNRYLACFAARHQACGVSRTYVLADRGVPGLVLGYYTLSGAQIDVANRSEVRDRQLSRYPLRCFKLIGLACRKDQKGKGLGRLLMGCAVDRCLKARVAAACDALVVHAKDEGAQTFFGHYGFIPCRDPAMYLYLPLWRR